MTAGNLLQRLVAWFEQAEIPYMLVGSFASTLHGMPRTTHDIDIVVDPTPISLATFLQCLSEDEYYVSHEAAIDALKRRTQFNIIDLATGWKVDLMILKRRAFSSEELRRRMPARILEAEVFVATAEDTILTKLEWSQKSGSERQLRDAASIIAVKGDDLDVAYIEQWAQVLGVNPLWEQLLAGRRTDNT